MRGDDGASEALAADWLALSRRGLAAVNEALRPFPETAERSATAGRGEGGDMSLVIDRAAEDALLGELERSGLSLTVITEERGEVPIGGGGSVHVVIDPIDGSLNAKRRLPLSCISLAVADGRTMGDVTFGYVAGLERGTEWWAVRGEGAYADGRPIAPPRPDDEEAALELVAIEAARPSRMAGAAEALGAAGAQRLRSLGAVAISMCFVAAAGLDAMLSLRGIRSVDAAAGQLIVREAGGAVSFPDAGGDPASVALDLDMRSRVLAARRPEMLDALLEAISRPS